MARFTRLAALLVALTALSQPVLAAPVRGSAPVDPLAGYQQNPTWQYVMAGAHTKPLYTATATRANDAAVGFCATPYLEFLFRGQWNCR